MKLKDQIACQRWSDCDLGKRAFMTSGTGYKNHVVFPQEYKGISSESNFEWRVYLKNQQTGVGNHQSWFVCEAHHHLSVGRLGSKRTRRGVRE